MPISPPQTINDLLINSKAPVEIHWTHEITTPNKRYYSNEDSCQQRNIFTYEEYAEQESTTAKNDAILEYYKSLDEKKRHINFYKLFYSLGKTIPEYVKQDFERNFDLLATQLSKLPIEKIKIEVSKNYDIKLALTFGKNRMLMITKPGLEESENDEIFEPEVIVYSYFIDKQLIVSNVANINEFMFGFQRLLALQDS